MSQLNADPIVTLSPEAQQQVRELLIEHGFEHHGFCEVTPATSLNHYINWLEKGYAGEMTYLERHLPQKENPRLLLPTAVSAIVVTTPYPQNSESLPFKFLKIAKYAQGEDYHNWFKIRVDAVVEKLKYKFKDAHFFAATDSKPILERDLAYRAGLGWVGKNTCIIDQNRGSYFLIAEILTSLGLSKADAPHPDRCGTCTRCIDACPTHALIAPRVLDARKCISYLTIESKAVPETELRTPIGDQFFGCDICQDVCPWNDKPIAAQPPVDHPNSNLIEEIRMILRANDENLKAIVKGTALERSKPQGLKRNAIIVAVNLKLKGLVEEISALKNTSNLKELAEWATNSLQS